MMVNISGVTAKLTSDIKQNGVNAEMVSTFELYASEEELMVRGTTTEVSGSTKGYGFGSSGNLTGTGKAGWDESIWKPWTVRKRR